MNPSKCQEHHRDFPAPVSPTLAPTRGALGRGSHFPAFSPIPKHPTHAFPNPGERGTQLWLYTQERTGQGVDGSRGSWSSSLPTGRAKLLGISKNQHKPPKNLTNLMAPSAPNSPNPTCPRPLHLPRRVPAISPAWESSTS